ncbi:protease complex subunit PrcB family protein [Flavobacterium sp.]|uniref:protease complex subunit PrcB family protein n=1 Tax=Flavobacterium sp. TaxID=239 RepID=UPI0026354394|nr:protease complex subunit PrcB family protein [Flavobacterium sp.]
MIKKGFSIFLILCLIGCATKRYSTEFKPLYEILTQQEDGGATIRFFEILTEDKEIKMLQNDALLKNKITAEDIKTSNFVILNMGEKTTPGYTIDIKSVEETADKIIIKVRDVEPKIAGVAENEVFYYPYSILKVNSKKEIIIQ